jgi:hypothetical protein
MASLMPHIHLGRKSLIHYSLHLSFPVYRRPETAYGTEGCWFESSRVYSTQGPHLQEVGAFFVAPGSALKVALLPYQPISNRGRVSAAFVRAPGRTCAYVVSTGVALECPNRSGRLLSAFITSST